MNPIQIPESADIEADGAVLEYELELITSQLTQGGLKIGDNLNSAKPTQMAPLSGSTSCGRTAGDEHPMSDDNNEYQPFAQHRYKQSWSHGHMT